MHLRQNLISTAPCGKVSGAFFFVVSTVGSPCNTLFQRLAHSHCLCSPQWTRYSRYFELPTEMSQSEISFTLSSQFYSIPLRSRFHHTFSRKQSPFRTLHRYLVMEHANYLKYQIRFVQIMELEHCNATFLTFTGFLTVLFLTSFPELKARYDRN